MARILVEQDEDGTKVPFLRGILVRSLQQSGLPFDRALELAGDVRDGFDGKPVVDTDEIKERVLQALRVAKLDEVAKAYGTHKFPRGIEILTPQGDVTELSLYEFGNRLQAIGLRRYEASAMVSDVCEQLLQRRKDWPVSSNAIGGLTYRLLEASKDFGPATARRWLVWSDFVYSGRPLVLLIGGSTGSGKSTQAADLASKLGITRMQSTDLLREVMRVMCSAEQLPLLGKSSFNAWQALAESDSQDQDDRASLVMRGYACQADAMLEAINAVVQRAQHERVSLIVEGVHVRPAHLDCYEVQEDACLFPIMLGVTKRKNLQQRIRGRSVQVPARSSEHFLKNFDDIWDLQSELLSEADACNIPIIACDERENVFREIMLALIEHLSSGYKRTAKEVFSEA